MMPMVENLTLPGGEVVHCPEGWLPQVEIYYMTACVPGKARMGVCLAFLVFVALLTLAQIGFFFNALQNTKSFKKLPTLVTGLLTLSSLSTLGFHLSWYFYYMGIVKYLVYVLAYSFAFIGGFMVLYFWLKGYNSMLSSNKDIVYLLRRLIVIINAATILGFLFFFLIQFAFDNWRTRNILISLGIGWLMLSSIAFSFLIHFVSSKFLEGLAAADGNIHSDHVLKAIEKIKFFKKNFIMLMINGIFGLIFMITWCTATNYYTEYSFFVNVAYHGATICPGNLVISYVVTRPRYVSKSVVSTSQQDEKSSTFDAEKTINELKSIQA